MDLYEFVNRSDMITFYAEDDEIAQVAAIYIGNGKAGLGILNNEREMPPTIFFTALTEDVKKTIKRVMAARREVFLKACHSFACCGFAEREIYDEYTKNGTDAARVLKWDDKNRTSMSDFCKYARSLKLKAVEKAPAATEVESRIKDKS